ncbi:MAG: hypothetical protein U1E38_05855 [Rhodospirillales bacterium]
MPDQPLPDTLLMPQPAYADASGSGAVSSEDTAAGRAVAAALPVTPRHR